MASSVTLPNVSVTLGLNSTSIAANRATKIGAALGSPQSGRVANDFQTIRALDLRRSPLPDGEPDAGSTGR